MKNQIRKISILSTLSLLCSGCGGPFSKPIRIKKSTTEDVLVGVLGTFHAYGENVAIYENQISPQPYYKGWPFGMSQTEDTWADGW